MGAREKRKLLKIGFYRAYGGEILRAPGFFSAIFVLIFAHCA
jgi:hypothetical protein